MKLSERRTRMLNNLGLTWLAMPQAVVPVAPPARAASQSPPTAPATPSAAASPPVFKQNNPAAQVKSMPSAMLSIASIGGWSQSDWSALQVGVANCQACGLCNTRRNTVFGEGSSQPRLLVLGDAPGDDDNAEGRPFAGQTGQLLDQMLNAIGLSRTADADGKNQVFITNTLKCQPTGGRNPEPQELAACDGFLQRQIQLLKPQVILALGKFAITQTLRDPALSAQPLGKLRAQVHHVEIAGHATRVIVSYHPSYLLRSPAERARAWEDLVLVADTLESLETTHTDA